MIAGTKVSHLTPRFTSGILLGRILRLNQSIWHFKVHAKLSFLLYRYAVIKMFLLCSVFHIDCICISFHWNLVRLLLQVRPAWANDKLFLRIFYLDIDIFILKKQLHRHSGLQLFLCFSKNVLHSLDSLCPLYISSFDKTGIECGLNAGAKRPHSLPSLVLPVSNPYITSFPKISEPFVVFMQSFWRRLQMTRVRPYGSV